MITLYGFPGNEHLVSFSPFCEKVAIWMRMAGLEFVYREGNPRQSPRGKLPWARIDEDTSIADSQQIIEALSKKYDIDLDAGLDRTRLARAHLTRRVLEEATYFALLMMRWVQDEGWQHMEPIVRDMLPGILKSMLPPLVRRGVRKQAFAQGTGRHEPETILSMLHGDLDAISIQMGEHAYFLGDEPRTIDATVYAFLGNMLYGPPTPASSMVREHPNLLAYCERMRDRFGGPAT